MATLDLYFSDPAIADLYRNREVCQPNYNPNLEQCPDSGFDLIVIEDVELQAGQQAKLDFQLKGVMWLPHEVQSFRTGYFLVPRSSFNDTPLIMQNAPGTIDAGFVGSIKMKVRALAPFKITRGTCLCQLVLPSLAPFKVNIKVGEEPPETKRGESGFGSTGNTAACGDCHVVA